GEARAEAQLIARLQPACALGESAPQPAAEVAMKRYRDSGVAAAALEAHRNDPRIVDHQHVARTQQGREVADAAILEIGGDDEKARRVARLDRPLGDELARKGEIEVIHPHGGSSSPNPAAGEGWGGA